MKWILLVVQFFLSTCLYAGQELNCDEDGSFLENLPETLCSFDFSPFCVQLDNKEEPKRKLWPLLSRDDYSQISKFNDSMFKCL